MRGSHEWARQEFPRPICSSFHRQYHLNVGHGLDADGKGVSLPDQQSKCAIRVHISVNRLLIAIRSQLSLSQVCGPNWAHAVDPSGHPVDGQPFSRLGDSSERWTSILASSTLYEAILELEKDLHSDPELFGEMSIYEQFTFLESLFVVHSDERIRGTDEDWLGIVDKVLEVIESQKNGGQNPETELSKFYRYFSIKPKI